MTAKLTHAALGALLGAALLSAGCGANPAPREAPGNTQPASSAAAASSPGRARDAAAFMEERMPQPLAWDAYAFAQAQGAAPVTNGPTLPSPWGRAGVDRDAALSGITHALARIGQGLYVYRDGGDGANWFTQRKRLANSQCTAYAMDELWAGEPYSGYSCIRCRVKNASSGSGGWLFLNGFQPQGSRKPRPNDGKAPGAGVDLTGAWELRFFAKGEAGGEEVEFFTAGFGRDPQTGQAKAAHPDASPRRSTGSVALTKQWREYVIPLSGAELDGIACGFGFSVEGRGLTTFYLDEIRFCGELAALEAAPALIPSGEEGASCADTGENALVALALLSAGREAEAGRIAAALCAAAEASPAGRVQNAYAPGVFGPFPGWESAPRPGLRYDPAAAACGPDGILSGTSAHTAALTMLALLQYHRFTQDATSLAAAGRLGDWALKSLCGDLPGFAAGVTGDPEASPKTALWSGEMHTGDNLLFCAAMERLYACTGQQRYREGAASALMRIDSMYSRSQDCFSPGAGGLEGDEAFLAVQALSTLALGELADAYEPALAQGTDRLQHIITSGAPIPPEETAMTALALLSSGREAEAEALMNACTGLLSPQGALAGLSPGNATEAGAASLAPAAWLLMAAEGFNPCAF